MVAKAMTASPVCWLAKRVPGAKKAGLSDTEKTEEVFRRNAIIEMLNYVYGEPSIAGRVRGYCKMKWTNSRQPKQQGANVEDMCTTIDTHDEKFKMASIGRHMRITSYSLGKAKTQDSRIIQQISRALLKCSGSLTLPPSCADPQVVEAACTARLSEQPARATIISEEATPVVNVSGDIDWGPGNIACKEGRPVTLPRCY